MNAPSRKAFSLGYTAGMRSMLMSINHGEAGDFRRGSDPLRIAHRATMSQRLVDAILRATNL